jgi:hypothetical protein
MPTRCGKQAADMSIVVGKGFINFRWGWRLRPVKYPSRVSVRSIQGKVFAVVRLSVFTVRNGLRRHFTLARAKSPVLVLLGCQSSKPR